MQFQHILIPTDFSGTAEPAVQHVLTLAMREQARVLLLHVLPALAVVEAEDRAQATAEEWLQEVTRQVAGPVETLVVRGTPATEICRVATERHCDLIAMSTHGRTGRARDLLGSVANEVLRQAPCAVLVFRAALFETPPE
jgi:nucleotide-binding universal stress UspA family protein